MHDIRPAAKPRIHHTYAIPRIGEPVPNVAPTPPPEHPEGAAWPPLYEGQDPWDGAEPLFRTFAVVGLKGSEEDDCIRASRGDAGKMQRALLLRSLAEVDGRPVNRLEFEEQELWASCPPLVRELWTLAYSAHNTSQRRLVDMFRASHEVSLK